MLQSTLLCARTRVCARLSGIHFYSCALCTHFTVKYSENVFYANICTKNVQTPMLTVQVVRRCISMVRMVYVAVGVASFMFPPPAGGTVLESSYKEQQRSQKLT